MKRGPLPNVERWSREFVRFKLAGGGKILFAIGALTACVGHPVQLPILYLFSAMFALGFVSMVVNWLMRPRIQTVAAFPERLAAGHTATGWITVTNQSRRTLFDLAAGFFGMERGLVAEPPQACGSLAGRGRAVLPVAVKALRRGLYVLPSVYVYTSFPFDVCRSGRKVPLGSSLLVTPSFHPLDGVELEAGRRYQPGGIALTSAIGESPEYIGNRPYRPGDSLRHIDMKAWARSTEPVVREYQEEFYCRVALVLDTHITARRRPSEGYPQLEAAVSLCAAVAHALSLGEYIIDVFAAGPELYMFRTGRHTAHFDSILEILACVEECRGNPFEVVAPALADELGSISSLVCLFLDWDQSREELVRTAQEAGCAVKIIVIRDGATTKSLEEVPGVPVQVLTSDEVRRGGIDRL